MVTRVVAPVRAVLAGRGRVVGLALALGLGLAAAPARADSPRLADARRAVEAVDYEAARRLLVDALHDGDNSPPAMREIYRLSARAAVVLGQGELAEQYYRCWLAIDPDAALPDDTAPKLREPFVAAQAYVAAHGRLRAQARRIATGAIDVELIADPLAMAHAAAVIDVDAPPAPAAAAAPAAPAAPPAHPAPVAFDAAHRARFPGGARIAILDERGNRLVELDPEAAGPEGAGRAASAPPTPDRNDDRPPWTQRWLTWAIPTGAFALGAAGFGIAAIASYGRANQIAGDSGKSFLSDAQDDVRRGRIFVWITVGAGAATIACAIPAAIYLSRDIHRRHLTAAPVVGPGRVGLALTGRF